MFYSKVNCPVVIERFPSHDQHKDEILRLLNGEPLTRLKSQKDSISFSDWEYHGTREIEYSRYFLHLARNTINQMMMSLTGPALFQPIEIDNVWCQRYNNRDTHSWHNHGKATLSFVYYLELPEGAPGTELMEPITQDIYQPEVKEGDILMFPGFLYHRSPENQAHEMKTIIAFNASYV